MSAKKMDGHFHLELSRPPLIVPKFDHDPLSFALRATSRIDEKHLPRPGNRSRTVGDGQIFSRFESPAVIFVIRFSVSDIPTIRLP